MSTQPVILGLDLASRLSGWTCGDGTEAPSCGAWPFPELGIPADHGLMLSTLFDYLSVTFQRFPTIAYVGFEAPILITNRGGDREYGDTLAKLRLLYPLGAFVSWYCRDVAHVPCEEVTVQEAKTEITGSPHGEKEEIARLAVHCGLVLPMQGRLDASDAWSVWKTLLRRHSPARSAEWDQRISTGRGRLL